MLPGDQASQVSNYSESFRLEVNRKSEAIERHNESIKNDRSSKEVFREENEDVIKMKDLEISGLREEPVTAKSEADHLN
ncbi:hypothetical protein [Burkholderia lata]|uniref:hypothetical protein n=1 Tax=Burkholderia lata (strain ATCC 17760 / DSM 23089 / LMG 22485 / NCIMB 9086 / R18194 / 383) TaxID=482957 RepID=UPI00158361AB|nr:hypothetical protein [Burkholderia lata]